MNDVTARDLQKKESQFTRCKGFDTFAPIGPCIATGLNGEPRSVEGWVNGERRQASSTKQLIFPIDLLVEFVTFVMTLEPGDIIATGTPEGIGPLTAQGVYDRIRAGENRSIIRFRAYGFATTKTLKSG